MKKQLLLIVAALTSASLFAQFNIGFQQVPGPSVFDDNNQAVPDPWVGGFNAPQFSALDLDQDGTKDLVVYDRQGGTIKTFLNGGTPNQVDYAHAPSYEFGWPKLEGYLLAADYNCDGKNDLFTYGINDIIAYTNTSSGSLSFSSEVEAVLILNTGLRSTVPLLPVDQPALVDVDGDGDLDILAFGNGPVGQTNAVAFYRNVSMDLYGHCDSLLFEVGDECWGKFSESFSTNDIATGVSCKRSSGKREGKHAGSNLLVTDLNGDGLQDVIIGDISYSNMVQLTNAGDINTANMSSNQDVNYPSSSTPIDLPLFPAAYLLDVNNDQKNDLVVGQSSFSGGENLECSWLYTNQGSSNLPDFSFSTKQFLVEDMIDFGSDVVPVLADLVGDDGLYDLLLGGAGVLGDSGSFNSTLHLYQNTGTATDPVFTLIDADVANLSQFPLEVLNPALVDLDADNDLDLVIGESQGTLVLFENIGGAVNPAFTLSDPALGGIDVGLSSAPHFADVDGDGDQDLIVGNKTGTLDYFENTPGPTSGTWSFSSTPTVEDFGGLDVAPRCCDGYSRPWTTRGLDDSDELYLLVGADNGHTVVYGNMEGNPNGTFTRVDSIVTSQFRTAITGADLNNDGKLELIIGEHAGGLKYFEKVIDAPLSQEELAKSINLTIFPNPVTDELQINWSGPVSQASIRVLNILGQPIATFPASGMQSTISLSELSSGVYLLEWRSESQRIVQRIIKN